MAVPLLVAVVAGLPNGWHRGEQLILELVVAAFKGAAVRTGAAFAVTPVAVALQVAAVEEVGLVAEGAGHPLPAQMVAGRVAIQQVLQEPVGSGFPVHPSPVHEPGGHPIKWKSITRCGLNAVNI